MPETLDLVGPGGWEHGFIAVRPPATNRPGAKVSARAHTSRLVSRDVARDKGSLRNASPSLAANRASAALRGGKHSDYQHLAAARLHAAAARSASSPDLRAHHLQMARMHRGIANRTPGRGTRSGSSKPTPNYKSPIGPSMGTLGKGATQTHTLPHGANALTKAGRAKAFQAGHALPPPSPGSPAGFPVTSPRSWDNALKAVGRAGSPERRSQLKALLRRTAAQYGKTAALKKSWAAANDQPALEFTVGTNLAITGPFDLVITRDPADGSAVVRHRRGGDEIGRIRHADDGSWRASRDGKDGQAHTRQRGALLELIGTHNKNAGTPYHRPAEQPKTEKQANPLADALGIPDMDLDAAQLATPANDSDDGPRVTGLSTGGNSIYKRLRKRGFPHARAHAFASRAQRRMGGSK